MLKLKQKLTEDGIPFTKEDLINFYNKNIKQVGERNTRDYHFKYDNDQRLLVI